MSYILYWLVISLANPHVTPALKRGADDANALGLCVHVIAIRITGSSVEAARLRAS
jgi:hypothetical protein